MFSNILSISTTTEAFILTLWRTKLGFKEVRVLAPGHDRQLPKSGFKQESVIIDFQLLVRERLLFALFSFSVLSQVFIRGSIEARWKVLVGTLGSFANDDQLALLSSPPSHRRQEASH